MIRITTTLLFFTLLFTACAERGTHLTPKNVQQKPMHVKTLAPLTKKKKKTSTIKQIQQEPEMITSPTKSKHAIGTKPQTEVAKIPVHENLSMGNDSYFTLSDETKNKISGFLIFVIGLMIFI